MYITRGTCTRKIADYLKWCSCYMCGNPRRRSGKKTRKEEIAEFDTDQQLLDYQLERSGNGEDEQPFGLQEQKDIRDDSTESYASETWKIRHDRGNMAALSKIRAKLQKPSQNQGRKVTRRGQPVGMRTRSGRYRIRFRKDGREHSITIDAVSENHAKKIKQAVVAAVKYYDFSLLDPESRRVCIDLFRRNGWEMPAFLTEPIPPISYAEFRLDIDGLQTGIQELQEEIELLQKQIHAARWEIRDEIAGLGGEPEQPQDILVCPYHSLPKSNRGLRITRRTVD